jgi:SAM-dependent methyltransferase
MRASTPSSSSGAPRVREHFRRKAWSFDHLYDEEHAVQRLLRPGLFRRREFALGVVRSYRDPRVLDVGCGSGRIGELALEAGARDYVGIDFSEPMLALARERLARFGERVSLVQGDFRETPLDEGFDVVLALGLFDYQADPESFATRMHDLTAPGGSVVASFPRWHWLKGPVRKLRYEVINDCPIFDYTEEGLRELFAAAGFGHVEVDAPGTSGFLVRAEPAQPRTARNGT